MDESLRRVDEWPVSAVSAGVVRPDGTTSTVGDPERVYELASITKVMAAIGVHLAVEEGSIGYDDVVLPTDATVRELLSHAGGIGPDGTVLDRPGRRRVYSNAGYDLLAAHVERSTDFAFADYLRVGVFEPLAMSSTVLDGSAAKDASSCVSDLLRFVTGLADLLAPSTIAAMVSPAMPELVGVLPGYGRQTPNPWGLGPEIRGTKSPHWTAPENSPSTWGHFGQAGTFLWCDPAHRVSAIVLTDRPFGDWALERWPALSSAILAESC